MIKILVINGANLNQLGIRDSSQYGTLSLSSITQLLQNEFPEVQFSFFQSNSENEIIETIHNYSLYDGIIINPGGFTHYSVGIRDALETAKIPKIEVHLSNLSTRENFRKTLITSSASNGYISGFKEISYLSAVYTLLKLLNKK